MTGWLLVDSGLGWTGIEWVSNQHKNCLTPVSLAIMFTMYHPPFFQFFFFRRLSPRCHGESSGRVQPCDPFRHEGVSGFIQLPAGRRIHQQTKGALHPRDVRGTVWAVWFVLMKKIYNTQTFGWWRFHTIMIIICTRWLTLGWLGLMMGNKFYIDFVTIDEDEAMEHLDREVGSEGVKRFPCMGRFHFYFIFTFYHLSKQILMRNKYLMSCDSILVHTELHRFEICWAPRFIYRCCRPTLRV